jgi:hypothetical protein
VLPVVLCGALLADLDRPVSKAEMARVKKVLAAKGHLDPATQAYYRLRGYVLAGRVAGEMTDDQVRRVMGATSEEPDDDLLGGFTRYEPLGVQVRRWPVWETVNGQFEGRMHARAVPYCPSWVVVQLLPRWLQHAEMPCRRFRIP